MFVYVWLFTIYPTIFEDDHDDDLPQNLTLEIVQRHKAIYTGTRGRTTKNLSVKMQNSVESQNIYPSESSGYLVHCIIIVYQLPPQAHTVAI